MTPGRRGASALFLAAGLAWAAAAWSAPRTVAGVPFLAQAPQRCGPASLVMVLRFWGVPVEEPQVAESTQSATLGGSLITDLAAFARARGLRAEISSADAVRLCRWVDEGQPVILLLDAGMGPITRNHFAVLHGYDSERRRYLLHSGRRRNQWVSMKRLERQWARAGRMTLRVAP